MKIPVLPLCLMLGGCVQSTHYGDYRYSSTVTHSSGQTVTQSDHAHWQGGGYTPPQANIQYHNGHTTLHVQTPRPAAPPPVVHYYPVYPQAAPQIPYIRSQQTILPACTQQRTVRHNGQNIVIQQPCY